MRYSGDNFTRSDVRSGSLETGCIDNLMDHYPALQAVKDPKSLRWYSKQNSKGWKCPLQFVSCPLHHVYNAYPLPAYTRTYPPPPHTNKRTHIHPRTHACMHIHIQTDTHTCTHTRTHARTRARTHARSHARTHARTHTPITYLHMRCQSQSLLCDQLDKCM